jgi:4-carboxymuconolactone decarboxylase
MARLPYATPSQLQEMLCQSPFPEDTPAGNVFRMLAHTPPVGAAAFGFMYSLLSQADLDARLREIAILRVVHRSDAPYAFAQHSAIATSVGVSNAQISSLEAGLVPNGVFEEREKTVVDVVDEALANSNLSEATFNRLRAHFPCRQIVELLLTIGCYRMMSRLVTLLELELEPVFSVDALRRAHESALA